MGSREISPLLLDFPGTADYHDRIHCMDRPKRLAAIKASLSMEPIVTSIFKKPVISSPKRTGHRTYIKHKTRAKNSSANSISQILREHKQRRHVQTKHKVIVSDIIEKKKAEIRELGHVAWYRRQGKPIPDFAYRLDWIRAQAKQKALRQNQGDQQNEIDPSCIGARFSSCEQSQGEKMSWTANELDA